MIIVAHLVLILHIRSLRCVHGFFFFLFSLKEFQLMLLSLDLRVLLKTILMQSHVLLIKDSYKNVHRNDKVTRLHIVDISGILLVLHYIKK